MHKRSDCIAGPRPCPLVSCRYHLLSPRVERVLATYEPGDVAAYLRSMPQTCALDVADEGGHTLQEIADVMGLSRERVRQLEASATDKIALAIGVERPTCSTCGEILPRAGATCLTCQRLARPEPKLRPCAECGKMSKTKHCPACTRRRRLAKPVADPVSRAEARAVKRRAAANARYHRLVNAGMCPLCAVREKSATALICDRCKAKKKQAKRRREQ